MNTIPNDNEPCESVPAPATEAAQGSVGKRLREARLARHLDVAEVAGHLHLDAVIIEALEGDDYARLPPSAFVRGYLRTYTRLLGLPAEVFIALYEQSGVAQDPPLVVHTPVRVQARSSDRRVRWITYVIVVVLGALFFTRWRSESSFKFWQNPPAVSGSRPGAPPAPLKQAGRAPAAGAQETPKPPAAATVVPPQTVIPTLPGMKLQGAPHPPAPAANNAAAGDSEHPSARIPSQGTHGAGPAGSAPHGTLVVRVDGECWVSVFDAAGKRLLYGLLLAGSTRTVIGQPPLRVVLGNAPVAHIEYDGRPFDLSRFAHVRFARFTVGKRQGSKTRTY